MPPKKAAKVATPERKKSTPPRRLDLGARSLSDHIEKSKSSPAVANSGGIFGALNLLVSQREKGNALGETSPIPVQPEPNSTTKNKSRSRIKSKKAPPANASQLFSDSDTSPDFSSTTATDDSIMMTTTTMGAPSFTTTTTSSSSSSSSTSTAPTHATIIATITASNEGESKTISADTLTTTTTTTTSTMPTIRKVYSPSIMTMPSPDYSGAYGGPSSVSLSGSIGVPELDPDPAGGSSFIRPASRLVGRSPMVHMARSGLHDMASPTFSLPSPSLPAILTQPIEHSPYSTGFERRSFPPSQSPYLGVVGTPGSTASTPSLQPVSSPSLMFRSPAPAVLKTFPTFVEIDLNSNHALPYSISPIISSLLPPNDPPPLEANTKPVPRESRDELGLGGNGSPAMSPTSEPMSDASSSPTMRPSIKPLLSPTIKSTLSPPIKREMSPPTGTSTMPAPGKLKKKRRRDADGSDAESEFSDQEVRWGRRGSQTAMVPFTPPIGPAPTPKGAPSVEDFSKSSEVTLSDGYGFIPLRKSSKSAKDEQTVSSSSCHQCKTRHDRNHLIFCRVSNKSKQKGQCRKKYCKQCLLKFYNENGPYVKWSCPACRTCCVCASCRRNQGSELSAAMALASGLVFFPDILHAAMQGQDLDDPDAAGVKDLDEAPAFSYAGLPASTPFPSAPNNGYAPYNFLPAQDIYYSGDQSAPGPNPSPVSDDKKSNEQLELEQSEEYKTQYKEAFDEHYQRTYEQYLRQYEKEYASGGGGDASTLPDLTSTSTSPSTTSTPVAEGHLPLSASSIPETTTFPAAPAPGPAPIISAVTLNFPTPPAATEGIVKVEPVASTVTGLTPPAVVNAPTPVPEAVGKRKIGELD